MLYFYRLWALRQSIQPFVENLILTTTAEPFIVKSQGARSAKSPKISRTISRVITSTSNLSANFRRRGLSKKCILVLSVAGMGLLGDDQIIPERVGGRLVQRRGVQHVRTRVFALIKHIMPQNPSSAGQSQSNQKVLGKRFKYVLDDLGNLTSLGVGANKSVKDIDLNSQATAYRVTGDGQDILERAGENYDWGEE